MILSQKEWRERAKTLLKSQLGRRQISYRDLAERLQLIGVHDTEDNINNKIARGGFSAVWFFQVMHAIGAKTLHLEDD